jgi:hypothetical protein
VPIAIYFDVDDVIYLLFLFLFLLLFLFLFLLVNFPLALFIYFAFLSESLQVHHYVSISQVACHSGEGGRLRPLDTLSFCAG